MFWAMGNITSFLQILRAYSNLFSWTFGFHTWHLKTHGMWEFAVLVRHTCESDCFELFYLSHISMLLLFKSPKEMKKNIDCVQRNCQYFYLTTKLTTEFETWELRQDFFLYVLDFQWVFASWKDILLQCAYGSQSI